MNATTALIHTTPLVIAPRDGGGVYRSSDAIVEQLGREIKARLREAAPRTVVRVRFEAPLSASAHARALGPALVSIASGAVSDRFLVVEDPLDENDYDAEAALEKESKQTGLKLVCVWLRRDALPSLIGAIDTKVAETYQFALDRWGRGELTTARALAEAEGLTIQTASNRVSKASSLGLLCNVEESSLEGGGVQNLFVPVT